MIGLGISRTSPAQLQFKEKALQVAAVAKPYRLANRLPGVSSHVVIRIPHGVPGVLSYFLMIMTEIVSETRK